MIEVTATVDLRGLTALRTGLEARVSRALYASAESARTQARALVPVRTGALRASIAVHRVGPLEARVQPDRHYAGYVEFGTRRMAAQPYLTPAAERERPRFQAAVDRAVREASGG